jgi:hypothetical protein
MRHGSFSFQRRSSALAFLHFPLAGPAAVTYRFRFRFFAAGGFGASPSSSGRLNILTIRGNVAAPAAGAADFRDIGVSGSLNM